MIRVTVRYYSERTATNNVRRDIPADIAWNVADCAFDLGATVTIVEPSPAHVYSVDGIHYSTLYVLTDNPHGGEPYSQTVFTGSVRDMQRLYLDAEASHAAGYPLFVDVDTDDWCMGIADCRAVQA